MQQVQKGGSEPAMLLQEVARWKESRVKDFDGMLVRVHMLDLF